MISEPSNPSASLTEFALIKRFFDRPITDPSIVLGVGDDAAVLQLPAGKQLVVTVDTFIEGRHFPPDAPARAIGHKALAVNLSDLAAMGAEPRWFTLALTLAESDSTWLTEFAVGLHALADAEAIHLIGGDTTRGPRSITIQAMGLVDPGHFLSRAGARAGDLIYVSGSLGDAAMGLGVLTQSLAEEAATAHCVQRLHWPQARLSLGRKLLGIASACIDISDGLSADLGHILEQSGVGACLDLAALPLSQPLLSLVSLKEAQRLALHGGDDYELCFTVPAARRALIENAEDAELAGCHLIGVIEADPGLFVCTPDGQRETLVAQGFDHFRKAP